MTPELFVEIGLAPALKLLPDVMDRPEARAMVIAICLQESRLKHRLQIGGPARGYAQFERGGGVVGVLTHPSSKAFATVVCERLDIAPNQFDVYDAIAFNDVLAAAFARLLLWTSPLALPRRGENDRAWRAYLSVWRPGKPHPETWIECYEKAWSVVEPG